MRAHEFITERKRKKSKKGYGGYFYPGYSFVGSDSGGDGGGGESINESPIDDLVKKLPSLSKHDYTTIDKLIRTIAKKHKLSKNALATLFKNKFKKTPSSWIQNKLDEETPSDTINIEEEVNKFVDWIKQKINLHTNVNIELSYDTDEAQGNHHTGGHVMGSDDIWVYAKNRNLVDILRTVAHELVHVRQGELNMIKPGDSYPGSPIEVLADAMAGKFIKQYGEENNHIFQ